MKHLFPKSRRWYKQPEDFRKRLGSSTFYHVLNIDPRAPVRLPQPMRPAELPGKDGEDLVSCLYYMREANRDRFTTVEDTLKAAFPGFDRLDFPPVAEGMLAMTWKDKSPAFQETVHGIFMEVPSLSLHICPDSSSANCLLQTARVDCLIMDLGLSDIENDELFLLHKHGAKTPVIVWSGSNDFETGAICQKAGACEVISKKPQVAGLTSLLERAAYWAGVNFVCGGHFCAGANQIDIVTKALFQRHFISVMDWAAHLRMTDRRLRQICEECLGAAPREIIARFQEVKARYSRDFAAIKLSAPWLAAIQ